MAKHAYLIAANANLSVVKACLRMIDDPRNDIYLHFDKKSHISKEELDNVKRVLKISTCSVLKLTEVSWGGVFSNKRGT